MYKHAGYLSESMGEASMRKRYADLFAEHLEFILGPASGVISFDTLILTGISGIVLGSLVAERLGKDITIVRRDAEMTSRWGEGRCHSSTYVEGLVIGKGILFDDQIDTGKTAKRVDQTLKEHAPELGLTHIYLYRGNVFAPRPTLYDRHQCEAAGWL